VICNVPQVWLLLKVKSGKGLSAGTLFVGNIAQFSQFTSGLVLKFNQIRACSTDGSLACQPSLLDLYQLLLYWLSFFPIFVLFLKYFPGDLSLKRDWRRWLIVARLAGAHITRRRQERSFGGLSPLRL